MTYLARAVDSLLDDLIPIAPAIAIEGAKGVGKTRSAERRAASCLYLDERDHAAIVRADPKLESQPAGTLLIDEWQRQPEVWDAVRRRVDRGAPPGSYLLTGSATPAAGVDTHSGAGRIVTIRMRPMALFERGVIRPSVSLAALMSGGARDIAGGTDYRVSDYFEAIAASGLPGIAFQHERLRTSLLDGYIHRIVDKDFPEQGLAVRRPHTLLRWLAAYAAASSSTTSYSRILDAATAGDGSQPAKTTTIAYRDLLSQLWLTDSVPGWSPSRSAFTRLQSAPKHQLADPALALRLCGLTATSLATARGAAMAGPLFESLATLGVRVAAENVGASVAHLRTGNGDHEVDLILTGSEGQVLAIEVKLAAAIEDADVRHLLWLRERVGDDLVDAVVLSTGSRAYRRRDGIAVVPLALLGP